MTSLSKLPRSCPFIIQSGRTFHIIVGSEPLLQLHDKPAEAFLALIATYFVFQIKYAEPVIPTLFYAQEFLVFDACDAQSNPKIRNFIAAVQNF